MDHCLTVSAHLSDAGPLPDTSENFSMAVPYATPMRLSSGNP